MDLRTLSHYVRNCVLVLGTLHVLLPSVEAKKPSPAPPPEPATGTVLFGYEGGIWKMNADDGSDPQPILNSVNDAYGGSAEYCHPSHATYDGIRWWLAIKETGQVYDKVIQPDGTVYDDALHRDLYAIGILDGELVADVRLTDYFTAFLFDIHYQNNLKFSPDDMVISATGQDLTGAIEEVNGETTIDVDKLTPMTVTVRISADEISVEGFPPSIPDDGCLEKTLLGRYEYLHSPTDELLVVRDEFTGLWIVIPPNADAPPHELGGEGTVRIYNGGLNSLLDWSHDGTRILFRDGSLNAQSISVNGEDLQFEMPRREDAKGKIHWYDQFRYTSDGQHIVYRHRIQKTVGFLGQYIERRNIATGTIVDLTNGLDTSWSASKYVMDVVD